MNKTDNLLTKTKNKAFGIVIITTIFSLSYAILRYNIFGQVPWKDLPFFILNKAISLTGIILFTISSIILFLNKKRGQIVKKRTDTIVIVEAISFSLIVIHVFISLILFKIEIFEKFFEQDGTLNLLGGISMIAGIISFVLLLVIKLNLISNKKNNHALYFPPLALHMVMIFIIVHLFFMGYNGWITLEEWHGGMPPISLIAFIFSSFGLLLKVLASSFMKNK